MIYKQKQTLSSEEERGGGGERRRREEEERGGGERRRRMMMRRRREEVTDLELLEGLGSEVTGEEQLSPSDDRRQWRTNL